MKVFDPGVERMLWLARYNLTAMTIYLRIGQNIRPETGLAYLDFNDLTKLVGVSENTVRKALIWLIEQDIIERVPGPDRRGFAYRPHPNEISKFNRLRETKENKNGNLDWKSLPPPSVEYNHDENGVILPGRPRHKEPSAGALKMRAYRARKKAEAAISKKKTKPKLALVKS